MDAVRPGPKMLAVLGEVGTERERQFLKLNNDTIPLDCADPDTPWGHKLAVLAEEFGEVAKSIIEQEQTDATRKELIQVAAVAVAWAESLSHA